MSRDDQLRDDQLRDDQLVQGRSTVPRVRFEPAAFWLHGKNSTTTPQPLALSV